MASGSFASSGNFASSTGSTLTRGSLDASDVPTNSSYDNEDLDSTLDYADDALIHALAAVRSAEGISDGSIWCEVGTGVHCVFPFKFNGVQSFTCTEAENKCATAVDDSGEFVSGSLCEHCAGKMGECGVCVWVGV
jgi:hypothetical protein